MDIILINGLKVQTTIGVFAWEQKIHQILKVSLEMAIHAKGAAERDELSDTLDYHAIGEAIINFGKENACKLIETFAERLSVFLMERFQIPWLKLQITKPKALPEAEGVCVTIERGIKPIDQ